MSAQLDKISWPMFALSSLAAAVGTWLTMLGWRVILRDLGSDLHLAPSSGVYFVGQLGKYLPGSLWSVLVQADIASHLKVPRRRTAVTGLLALGLSLLTGLLVGLPATSFLLQRDSDGFAGGCCARTARPPWLTRCGSSSPPAPKCTRCSTP